MYAVLFVIGFIVLLILGGRYFDFNHGRGYEKCVQCKKKGATHNSTKAGGLLCSACWQQEWRKKKGIL